MGEDAPQAIVYLSIASSEEIRSCAMGVEPEHAAILLPALEDMVHILREHAARRPTPSISWPAQAMLMQV